MVSAGVLPLPAVASASSKTSDPLADLVVVNTMGGLVDPNVPAASETGAPERAIRDNIAAGLSATILTASGVVPEKGIDYFEQTVRDMARWRVNFAGNAASLTSVERAADILAAKRARKLGVILALQNGAAIGDRVDRLDILYNLGLRSFQLTYNGQNLLGCGGLVPNDTGLTALGRDVIERGHALKMMIDLSHSGPQTGLDAARYTKLPISINHTACAGVTPSPRNKSDEELRLVAEKGGYVGIFTMPYLAAGRRITGDDVVAHIEHAIKLCGEDHVGIGTDNVVTPIDDMPKYMAEYARIIAQRRAQGISAPGEDPNIPRFAADLADTNQFRVIADKLRRRGHSPARIAKIMGGNFVRFARDVWGG
jgi:membrane dipeptidase